MSEVVVRIALPGDYEAAAELVASVFINEGFSAETARPTLSDVASRASHAKVFVAADAASGEVIGTVTLVPSGTPSSQIAREGEMEVRLLAAAPEARGRGVGEALMAACIAEAKRQGARSIVLSTQTTMLAAHRLYERLGFIRQPARDWERPNSGRPMLVYTLPLR